uniref:RNA-directed RNA polymerase n=1 Tax=Caenorhabditis japonica TaxID=281687 RepID=A0A8R1I9H6_CAEJA
MTSTYQPPPPQPPPTTHTRTRTRTLPNNGYVRLTIPRSDPSVSEEEWQFYAKKQEDDLLACFKYYSFRIFREGESIRVSGELEDPLFETTYMKYDKSHRSSLALYCTDLFEKKLTFVPFLPDEIHNIQSSFSSTLLDVPTYRIFFGNIHDNEFYNHWQVSFPPNYKQKLAPNRLKKNCQYNVPKLQTHFEFDKSSPITVEYCTSWRDTLQKYRIAIDGESLHKIIVDCLYYPHEPQFSGQSRARIYLVLNSPAKVSRCFLRNHSGRKHMGFQRVLELYWGADRAEESSKKVLTENRIFCLELPTLSFATFYTIISRLRLRWNTQIVFGKLTDHVSSTCLFDAAIPKPFTNQSVYGKWVERVYDPPSMYKSTEPVYPCDIDEKLFKSFLNSVFPKPPAQTSVRNKAADRNEERKFTYVYLIEALLSRGAVVKDQLILCEEDWKRFLDIIKNHYWDDNDHYLCESALEDLLNHVDLQPNVGNLLNTFERFCEARRITQVSNQMTKEEWNKGFRKVRKAILTPTRILYMVPEIIMSNRALAGADHDGTRIIRTVFKDDSGLPMRPNMLKGLLKPIVLKHLSEGFTIMGRDFGYLGSSNSQMRENGGYFMERYNSRFKKEMLEKNFYTVQPSDKPKIIAYRKSLGKFEELESIPKAMSRLGLCFTQARVCNSFKIGLCEYQLIHDVIGGKNEYNAPYTFTDGIGIVSVALAEKIARSQQFPTRFTPSAFQIRFRGFKGMLVVDPGLDIAAAHFKTLYKQCAIHNQEKLTGDNKVDLSPWTKHCLFRKSQFKFKSATSGQTEWPIELVKWSSPAPVNLNRPFINILDQVSANQSYKCHKRVVERIETLLDDQMTSFGKWIMNEESCRSRLSDIPHRINFSSLEQKFGFNLSTEPFFRDIIKAAIDVSMSRLSGKIQIQIPQNLGRTMFGVTDETGQLQYGQVFVKYTTNMNDKFPSQMANSIILKGDVMITKFPAIVPGDVRMFEAVDVPELHHLTNVVVFPQSGPRPQPDEMAGSDLDGDEYAVIWDKELFLEKNEQAFEYCSDKPPKEFKVEEMDSQFHEFFAEYMSLDSVGQTSVNHLYQSDQYGLTSEVCFNIAKKNSMALDFSKSGVAPEPLTNRWTYNTITQTREPPERSDRQPDFSIQQCRSSFVPVYTSSRLLGCLWRELRLIKDVIVASTERQIEVVPDEFLVWNGWQDYEQIADEQMKRYNSRLRSLMDSYGIQTEAELFSGCFRSLTNRVSDREADDMSLYNTEYIIEAKMTDLYRTFREEFFAEFVPEEKGYMKVTEPECDRYNDDCEDVLRRVCRLPNERMMAKAVAYYKVCYNAVAKNSERKLSFAWIASDILGYIKSKNVLVSEVVPGISHPLFRTIYKHRQAFISENTQTFHEFMNRIQINNLESNNQERTAQQIIQNYIQMYPGLEKYMFIIDTWARAARVLQDADEIGEGLSGSELRVVLKDAAASRFKWYHLSLLTIMLATKRIDKRGQIDSNNGYAVVDVLSEPLNHNNSRMIPEDDLDRLTLSFFRHLSSRWFKSLRYISFQPIGFPSIFMRGEWLVYRRIAIRTYFNILLNLRFDDLPLLSESAIDRRDVIKEGVPFVVNLPVSVDVENVLEHLRLKSKCTEIKGRLEFTGEFDRVLISARGTVEALEDLRNFVSVKLPRYSYLLENDNLTSFVRLTYYQITGVKWNAHQLSPRSPPRSENLAAPATYTSPHYSPTGSSPSSPEYTVVPQAAEIWNDDFATQFIRHGAPVCTF